MNYDWAFLPMAVSNGLLGDREALRQRLDEDGYLYFSGLLDREKVLRLRRKMLVALRDAGWVDPDSVLMRGRAGARPVREGSPEFLTAYDAVQKVEEFHTLAHDDALVAMMRDVLGDTAFAHPLKIARLIFPDNYEVSTPPHQDYPNNQGTPNLTATWIPVGDLPSIMGGIAILRGSHRWGVLPLTTHLGAGNRCAVLPRPPRRVPLGHDGVRGRRRIGVPVAHRSRGPAQRVGAHLRLSVDFRYQQEGEALTAGCLEPHFERLTWEEIYAGWSDTKHQYYWRDLDYEVVPFEDYELVGADNHKDVAEFMAYEQRSSRPPRPGHARRPLSHAPPRPARVGRPFDAIRILTEANRHDRDARVEERLVTLRHECFEAVDTSAPPAMERVVSEPGPDEPLPELGPDDLSVATLRAGFARHGCVLVRELIPPDRAEALAAGIDRALAAFDLAAEGTPTSETSPWYRPFTPRAGKYRVGGRRKWMRASGGMWTVDSPHMLFEVLDLVEDTGVGQLITDYFGERPALSANKCNLRRVPVDTQTNWHQDGAFLGADVRSVNLWLGLSQCGVDAPGLDIVPHPARRDPRNRHRRRDLRLVGVARGRRAGRHARAAAGARSRRRAPLRSLLPAPHRGGAGHDARSGTRSRRGSSRRRPTPTARSRSSTERHAIEI